MACTSAPLHGIELSCDSSKGGIKNVWISPYIATNATLDEDKQVNITNFSDYKKFYVKKNTTSFASALTVDPANGVNYVTTTLSLVFNRMDKEKQIEMTALSVNDVNIVVEDSNGNFWYLGLNNPVYASNGTAETGTAKTDGNKYTIEFTDDSDTYPFTLNAASIQAIKNI